ncbi:copper transporter [Vibrio sp. qd031]|nr:copper transporter [Vibrio sp. qd031]
MNIELIRLGTVKTLSLSVAVAMSALPSITIAAQVSLSEDIAQATLQLNSLIESALTNDTSRSQFAAQSAAMRETAVATSTLMDPKLKVGFGGLPVDSFKFDEDPMTNISVGIMQQFERGATLDLNHRKANQQADGVAFNIQARERDIANSVTQLWLELGYLQQSAKVIKQNQQLMVELENFVQTNYSIGNSEAQDLLNAQLKVDKLDEKLQSNRQMQSRIVAQLSEWLGSQWLNSGISTQASYQLNWTRLDSIVSDHTSDTQFYSLLNQHPMARMADATISANRTQVELAEQAYTPQFGVEVMYAYRQADNMRGEPASDLLSAYLTLDIPLFTDNRQDKSLNSAQYQVGASQYQKDAWLSQMNAQVNALMADKVNLLERIERFEQRLLPQAQARIEAVERGYQNNTAQFGDVITAASDELALNIELIRLKTDLHQTYSKLASLLGGFEYQVDTPVHTYPQQQ